MFSVTCTNANADMVIRIYDNVSSIINLERFFIIKRSQNRGCSVRDGKTGLIIFELESPVCNAFRNIDGHLVIIVLPCDSSNIICLDQHFTCV